jgi:Fe-S-cluster containining protein
VEPDEVFEAITEALDRMAKDSFSGATEVTRLRKELDTLVEVLVARGALTEGHKRHLARATRQLDGRPTVRLKVWPDKYTTPNADVDCLALMHLCKARCCSLRFALSRQDIEEGKIKFDVDDPYMIRHDADGLCTHFDRAAGGGCGAYEHRPAPCRIYDCRQDQRIWKDWDAKIPQPVADWLELPKPPTR